MSSDTEQAQPPAGKRALAVTALTAASVLALAACGARPGVSFSAAGLSSSSGSVVATAAPASVAQTLSETGSSLMAPLFALWGPAYHAQFSQVTLRTASSSSGTGVSAAAARSTDIGASDAYLSPADVSKYTSLLNIPLAVAALMVVYNVPGVSASAHLRLNGTVLAQMYAGQVTRWNDPLPPSVVTLSDFRIAETTGLMTASLAPALALAAGRPWRHAA